MDADGFLKEIEKDDKIIFELKEINNLEIRDEFFEIREKINSNLKFFVLF